MKENKIDKLIVVLTILNLVILLVLTINIRLLTGVISKQNEAVFLNNKSIDAHDTASNKSLDDRPIIDSSPENPQILRGTIKKEVVPEELELGDHWYWIYFDKPHLLVNNSAGFPLYIDKIQLVPSENADLYNIENFTNERVEVYGYQTWGYAESSVFQILSMLTDK